VSPDSLVISSVLPVCRGDTELTDQRVVERAADDPVTYVYSSALVTFEVLTDPDRRTGLLGMAEDACSGSGAARHSRRFRQHLPIRAWATTVKADDQHSLCAARRQVDTFLHRLV
jgi:hypothetical protein